PRYLDVHVSRRRVVAARTPRRTARVQRHDAELSRRASRPSAGGRSPDCRRGQGGDAVKRLLSLLIISCMVSMAAGARSSAGTAAGDGTPGPDAAGAAPGDLTVDASALHSIAVETIAERPVPRTLTVAGKVQFDEDRLAHVLAPLAGQVVDLHVKVGDVVRK